MNISCIVSINTYKECSEPSRRWETDGFFFQSEMKVCAKWTIHEEKYTVSLPHQDTQFLFTQRIHYPNLLTCNISYNRIRVFLTLSRVD